MFFNQINQMMNKGVDITLVIRKNEGILTVATLPKTNGLKDEAQNHIVPLTISGTPKNWMRVSSLLFVNLYRKPPDC